MACENAGSDARRMSAKITERNFIVVPLSTICDGRNIQFRSFRVNEVNLPNFLILLTRNAHELFLSGTRAPALSPIGSII
jgi:hypothetical protein